MTLRLGLIAVLASAAAGCGDDGDLDCTRMICPGDGGGGDAARDAASTDGGGGTDGAADEDGGGGDDGGGGADGGDVDAAACDGIHPMVEGDRRFCGSGRCYCGATDACYPAEVAAACCSGTLGMCGPPAEGCMGTHPIVEGDRRFCMAPTCYCANPDACFPAAEAARCCAVAPTCP